MLPLTLFPIYTFLKKDFGQQEAKHHAADIEFQRGIVIGIVIGFYDGLIGPGAGSFLIMAFIILLHYKTAFFSVCVKIENNRKKIRKSCATLEKVLMEFTAQEKIKKIKTNIEIIEFTDFFFN